MLGDALSFPTNGEEPAKTVLVGGILLFLGALFFLPALPVQGYYVEVLRRAANGEREPPTFDDWERLFVDGLELFVVYFVYLAVPSVLLFVALFVALGGAVAAAGDSAVGAGIGLVGGLLVLVALLAFLVALYLLPAAMTNYATHEEVTAGFDLGTVVGGSLTGNYVLALTVAGLLYLVVGSLGALFLFVFVGAFVLFWVQTVAFYLVGRGYAAGVDHEPDEGDATGSAPSLD